MNPTSAILIGGLIISGWAFVAVRESARGGWRKELRDTIIRERNRNRFARLRRDLMVLSREGHIDANSEFFFKLYMTLTGLLREPEKQMEMTIQLLSPPVGRSDKLSIEEHNPRAINLLVEVGIDLFWATNPADRAARERLAEASAPVIISTIHSAKGLEFPRVIVCELGREDDDLETARKLAYVGMTRATDELCVVTTSNHPLAHSLTPARARESVA